MLQPIGGVTPSAFAGFEFSGTGASRVAAELHSLAPGGIWVQSLRFGWALNFNTVGPRINWGTAKIDESLFTGLVDAWPLHGVRSPVQSFGRSITVSGGVLSHSPNMSFVGARLYEIARDFYVPHGHMLLVETPLVLAIGEEGRGQVNWVELGDPTQTIAQQL